ncbi:MAG: phosphatidate cytidylyltransferase [Deltaproteobacteria bacterium]|jgi:phosphatidate cytidylyltransferase|nr:MAG: phosphatidate cytidylyltransferase [Deltaproteobacteria bacterium]
MSNLAERVITAAFGLPILFFIFYLGGIPFLIFTMVVIFAGQLELFKLLGVGESVKERVILSVLGSLTGLGAYFGFFYLGLLFTLSILAVLVMQVVRKNMLGALNTLGLVSFGFVYVGWLLSHAVLLRNLEYSCQTNNHLEEMPPLGDWGFTYVVFVVACVFVNDSVAYFVGRWKGKRKLVPRLSPGKTVEGTLGGFCASVVTGVVVDFLFGNPFGYLWASLMGFIVSVVALLGDLSESLIKRNVGVKDSGEVLPGHGGVLDRFDSLIFAFPVFYYLTFLINC